MRISPGMKQTIYASGVQWNMFSLGMVMAYSASLIPELMDPRSDIKIDLQMASWIASLPGLSGVIPTVLLGPLMHYTGRRVANICLSIPMTVGWVLTYFSGRSKSIAMLLVGRFLQGLCFGAPYFISVCIGEFSSPKMRSYLLGTKPLFCVLGVTLTHSLAYVLDWKHLALVGVIPPVLALVVTIFSPNTPEWLVSRGRYEEARMVFDSLRGYSEEGEREISQMIETERNRRQRNKQATRRIDVLKNLKSPVLWKPVGVLFFALIMSMAGGRHFIASYSFHLAAQLSGDQSNGYFYAIIGDVISVAAAFMNIYLVRVYSRRRILFGTGFPGFVLLATASFMLYVRTANSSVILTYSILIVFALYYFLANVGFFPVSFMLMGEIFPLEYRAVGSVIDGMLGVLGLALVLGGMPWLENYLGTHGVLLFYGSILLFCLVYLYYALPETKNRSLHDVGDYFRGKSPKIRNEDDLLCNVTDKRSILKTT